MDNLKLRIIIGVVALLYIISPIDAMPGPIDDVIVALLAGVLENKMGKKIE